MRIVVTGATGFIGRCLMQGAAHAGHETVTLDLRGGGSRRLRSSDCVVHLAAIAHRRAVSAEEIDRVNVGLTRLVGAAAAEAGSRLVFMSSVKVHGEASGEPFTEDSPLAPQDAYAASKAKAEELLRAMPGLKLTILRPPLVYGPGVKANFLALMHAIGRGIPLPLARVTNRRSLVYVGNLVDAVLRCATEAAAIGRTYLVSDGESLSTRDLCRKLGQALGCEARLFSLPVSLLELLPAARKLTRSLEVDSTAITAQLQWHQPFPVDDGLRRTADWYRHR